MNDVKYQKEIIRPASMPRRVISGNGRAHPLTLVVALCAAIGCVAGSTAAFADGDGLRIQRDYERRQIDCARRWRDHLHDQRISMMGCVSFDESTPDAAEGALAADARGEIYVGPERGDWTP